MKKSLFALTLSSVLLVSSTSAAFASTPSTTAVESKLAVEQNLEIISDSVSILTNNENEIIVKEVTADGITLSKNNKITNILTIEKYDISGLNLLSTDILNLNDIQPIDQVEPALDYSYQHTFMNREYDIFFHNDGKINWDIRSADRKKSVTEGTKNKDNLKEFRAAVERLNSAEFAVISAVGLGTATTIFTAFATGGLGAAIAAAGSGAAVSAALLLVNSAISDADYYYNRVK